MEYQQGTAMKLKSVMIPVLVLAAFGSSLAQNTKLDGMVGKKMPAFSMTDRSGKKLSSATLSGKVVLLDFWATWCGPCKAVMPVMQRLYSKYSGKGLVVVGVDVMEQGDPSTATANIIKQKGLTYPFARADAFGKQLGISGIPVKILIDRKGVVRAVSHDLNAAGVKGEEAALDAAIQKALASK